ncbi:hypothetical protein ACET3X_010023 [Alternaria dauci]|uniref:Uncharacterized protein n=1 Tax=Alternaria dauci TaxID=48095 RepID=A0ABR3U846_9PLEO
MDERLRYNSEKLQKLLQLWKDCPIQIHSILSPGIARFFELSKKAAKYEGVRYPQIFLEYLCDASILALQRGEALSDWSESSLLTAWDAAQLSISLTDDPALWESLLPSLTQASIQIIESLQVFDYHREKQSEKPLKWKLILEIQKLGCEGTLDTLQMLRKASSKEDLASKLRDLDEKGLALAEQALDLRQKA